MQLGLEDKVSHSNLLGRNLLSQGKELRDAHFIWPGQTTGQPVGVQDVNNLVSFKSLKKKAPEFAAQLVFVIEQSQGAKGTWASIATVCSRRKAVL